MKIMAVFFWYSVRSTVASSVDDIDVQLLQTRILQKGPELGWTQADLLTSAGENKCLNLETSGFSGWDCNGLEGRSAAVPYYCTNDVERYNGAVPDKCCKDECALLAAAKPGWTQADLLTSAGENKCLNLETSGFSGWDCNGLEGRSAAVPYYCTNDVERYNGAVPDKCCKDECALLDLTTTTTPTFTTTTIPGGDTNIGGADCFGAIATFGPDFECNFKVSSFCEHDSGDGLDVSACCQDYCNGNREKTTKQKVSEREAKAAEGVRKSDRQESSSKRQDAEALRKKNKKEAEWLQKRGAQETANEKAEDERKTKRGYSESKKKNERSWKGNRQAARKNAQRREADRKSERALKGQNNDKGEGKRKARTAKKEQRTKKKEAQRTKKKEALAKNTENFAEKRKKINSKGQGGR